MHPTLVRHLVSPLLERALGRRTFSYLVELEESQWWSPEDLRNMQDRKLALLLKTANKHCPYYARLFHRQRLDPTIQKPREVLSRLPLLDKQTIRDNLEAITNHRVPGGTIRFNTGGSTGEPLVFYVDRRRVGYDKAARILTHQWFGADPGQRETYLWGSPVELRTQDHLKRFRDIITNEMLLEAFNLSPQSMTSYLQRIHTFDPVSIFGYPSSLTTFAEYCRECDRTFNGVSLKAVFVTGEPVSPKQRQIIHDFFRAPVANCYGSRDGGFIAHECPHGQMHIFDQNLIVETVDTLGNTLPIGSEGEIVITHLDALATPLLRYRTGDVGRLLEGQCSCGRGMALMAQVKGRQTDQLVAADGALQHALSAIYIIRELKTVRQFQLRQQADRSVDAYVIPDAGFSVRDQQHITEGLKRRLGESIPIRLHLQNKLATEGSGKFRHVISYACPSNTSSPAQEHMGGVA